MPNRVLYSGMMIIIRIRIRTTIAPNCGSSNLQFDMLIMQNHLWVSFLLLELSFYEKRVLTYRQKL